MCCYQVTAMSLDFRWQLPSLEQWAARRTLQSAFESRVESRVQSGEPFNQHVGLAEGRAVQLAANERSGSARKLSRDRGLAEADDGLSNDGPSKRIKRPGVDGIDTDTDASRQLLPVANAQAAALSTTADG